ncbi:MAG: D-2-hydroxyacid dehydrogenase [Chloroflexi bacterium]|nr:D-2-hydroxyacid dehydrogenase [Chloroflexota bacterium]
MKALLLAEFGKPFYPRLRELFPDVDFVEADSPEEIEREVVDAEVVFGYLTGSQFEAARNLKWIQTLDAGMEGLFNSVPGIADTDIMVTNAQGAGAPMIGEHAVTMILMFARGMDRFAEKQRAGSWDQEYGLSIVQVAMRKTVGVIGLGKSGMEAAWRCKALGMNVIAVDRHDVDGEPVVEDVWGLDRLGDLLEQSDFVVVTVPYTPENENMLGAAELAKMKSTAYLIVTSRGRIVEHGALVAALRNGVIAGAGLDAVVEEPLPSDNELFALDNVVITPHIAGNSPELDERTYDVFERNMRRYMSGDPLRNVVDKGLRY